MTQPNAPPRSTPIGLARDVAGPGQEAAVASANTQRAPVSILPGARIPEVGEILAEKFLLESCIGSGGMGVVFQGEHLLLKTRIALKCLRPELCGDSAALARFLQEARLAASIENEHSTRIHDVGTTADGLPYIVMEYLRGVALDAHLQQHGPLPVLDVVTIVLQLLSVLAEAHGKGLVHRDLKPANLFLQERSTGELWVKVMDFGISKSVGPEPMHPLPAITTPHTFLGSPQYMSPEQLRDASTVDQRSDIWSTGVVLYELLSGVVPFEAESLADLCSAVLNREPASLQQYRGDIPPGLEEVVRRTLAKDPNDRPQTVGELALLLAPYAPEPARASVGRINAACLKSSRALRASTPLVIEGKAAPRPARNRYASLAMGFALVAAAGAAAYVLAPRLVGREPAAPSVASAMPQGEDVQLGGTAVVLSAPPKAREVPSAGPSTLASSLGPAPASTTVAPARPRVAPQPSSTRIRKTSQIQPLE